MLVILALLLPLVLVALLHRYLRRRFLPSVVRIFQEKPLFIIPRGQPVEGAEEIKLETAGGLMLQACYLRTPQKDRKGVLLFGLEFGSNRWSCVPYCESLLEHGYDVFTFEPRSQGDSDCQPGYEPLQWVTEFEVEDMKVALAYLKARPDADPRGIGLFGISKGGTAGLIVASSDPYVRCCATDGIFGTKSTMLPYMRKWLAIYSHRFYIHDWVPWWYFRIMRRDALREIETIRNCKFAHVEKTIAQLAPRPWLMIHGGGDTYIKPDMAQAVYDLAGQPKECWLVEGAKHNQALHLAHDEYQTRVLNFFDAHLGGDAATRHDAASGGRQPSEEPATRHPEEASVEA